MKKYLEKMWVIPLLIIPFIVFGSFFKSEELMISASQLPFVEFVIASIKHNIMDTAISFNMKLGVNTTSFDDFYNISILLARLASKSDGNILEVFNSLFIIRALLGFITMNILLLSKKIRIDFSLALSLVYAFSGYLVYSTDNVIFLDAIFLMPLIIYGVDSLERAKLKFNLDALILFAILLSFPLFGNQMLSTYFIIYVLYSAFNLFVTKKKINFMINTLIITLGIYCVYSLSFDNMSFLNLEAKGALINLQNIPTAVARLFPFLSAEFTILPESIGNYYITITAFIIMFSFYDLLDEKTTKLSKYALVLFMLCLVSPRLTNFLTAPSTVVNYPGRFSNIIPLIVVVTLGLQFKNYKKLSMFHLIKILFVSVSVLAIAYLLKVIPINQYYIEYSVFNQFMLFLIACILVILIVTLLSYFFAPKIYPIIIAMIIVLELFTSHIFAFDFYRNETYFLTKDTYTSDSQYSQIEKISNFINKDDSFYRVITTFEINHNYGLLFGMNLINNKGIFTDYAKSEDQSSEFLKNVRTDYKGNYYQSYLLENYLGVKYIISEKDRYLPTLHYKNVYETKDYIVFENELVRPFFNSSTTYLTEEHYEDIDKKIKQLVALEETAILINQNNDFELDNFDFHFTILTITDRLHNDVHNDNGKLTTKKGNPYYEIHLKKTNKERYHFVDLDYNIREQVNLENIIIYYADGTETTLNMFDATSNEMTLTLALGYGNVEKIRLNLKEDTFYNFKFIRFYALEADTFNQFYDDNQVSATNVVFDDDQISATLTVDQKSIITTTLPSYGLNQKIKLSIDGNDVKRKVTNFGLTGFILESGTHDIVLSIDDDRYLEDNINEGLMKFGIVVSFLSILVYTLLFKIKKLDSIKKILSTDSSKILLNIKSLMKTFNKKLIKKNKRGKENEEN